ncbi:hypothetical protein ON010_g8479 [Phytophthora cinnamomi]|nr:hypothetical protein ON010_g8479 [Phytophthora cinnamomi]
MLNAAGATNGRPQLLLLVQTPACRRPQDWEACWVVPVAHGAVTVQDIHSAATAQDVHGAATVQDAQGSSASSWPVVQLALDVAFGGNTERPPVAGVAAVVEHCSVSPSAQVVHSFTEPGRPSD